MQFGVVERKVAINKPPNQRFSLLYPLPAGYGNVCSGIGFLCKEAQRGDLLFLLPGLRYPVVLRRILAQRYRLIGECILRVGKDRARMEDISIETKS